MTFQLNRQIPSGSKVKLLQFNFNTGDTTNKHTNSFLPSNNGVLVCIDNLMTTNSFTNNDLSVTQTHPILASIPNSALFEADSLNHKDIYRFKHNSYEPTVCV